MKRLFLTILLLPLLIEALGQDATPFVIYNSKGKEVKFKNILKSANKSDVLLFGEYHNNPISHWLELELLIALSENKKVVLGAEMFESDNQTELNRYLSGEIDFEGLDSLARLWPNYETDYAPLVDFTKNTNIPFIATNIPRRFANLVYKEGGFSALDSLTDLQKSWIAPLPISFDPELSQYQKILEMMEGHGTPDLVKAQAIKDATMAHFILSNFIPGDLFLHFNGAFHSDFHEGILWYLKLLNPEIKCLTISTVEQVDVSKLKQEHIGRADFIIVVKENMTKTY
ncbi:MAG: ChaN family lipoprotein [Flavobacteriales bacterium]|nr:ChaN family lipoprotein [Flavobacteriales bacterium]